MSRLDSNRINRTLLEAKTIASVAERYRETSIATVIQADGTYVHTTTLFAKQNAANFNALIQAAGENISVPEVNPYGFAYTVEINPLHGLAYTTIPGAVRLDAYLTTFDGVNTIVTVPGERRRSSSMRHVVYDQKSIANETIY
ncbi:MAG: hypothetical protein V3T17_09220 [Pseudomonadales bacterium]